VVRLAVLLAFAAFVLGTNSSGCPSGFFPLDYEKACQRAAEQLVPLKPYGGSLGDVGLKAAYMSGCYWHTVDGSVYFNDKVAIAPGSVDSFALQLCAGAPIPAPRYATHTAERITRQGLKACFLGLLVRCVRCLRVLLRVRTPASERACLYACVHLGLHTIHPSIHPSIHSSVHPPSRPSRSVHPSIHPIQRSILTHSFGPRFVASPFWTAGLRCVRAAKCECSSGGSGSLIGKRYSRDPLRASSVMLWPGPHGLAAWACADCRSHMLSSQSLCVQGTTFLLTEMSIVAPGVTRGSKK
jgi:hypothetical protein